MRISLNLATRPYADIRPALKRLRIAMGALAVIALGLGLGLRTVQQKAGVAREAQQRVQNQIDQVNQERLGYQNLMHQPDNMQLIAQVGTLNQLFDEKAFSWTLAMEDLETVLPAGVQVTNLEPVRAKNGPTTLRLRVVGPRDRAVELVANLEHSKHFLLPRIVSESAESSGGPSARLEPVSASNRVNFELLAEYNSASPPERKTEAGREGEKPSAAGEHTGQPAPPLGATRRLPPPANLSEQAGRPPSTGLARTSRHPHPSLNPGGPQ
jgi:type IV pilus assembly protein PilN